MSEETKQKIVLITGCSSGIGLETVIECAKAGHRVFATMRNLNKKEKLEKRIKNENLENIEIMKLDVSNADEIELFIAKIMKIVKRIDVLFNNAGYMVMGSLEDSTINEIRSQINNLANDVNFGGVSLISSEPSTLDVSFSDNSSSSLSIVGVPSDSQALGISSAVTTGNNFATDANIQNAVGEIASAVTTLRSTSSSLGTNNAVLSIREEFSTNIANIAEEGAAKLTEADLTEEAAVQVSAQAQGELSLLGASIANQTNQSILDLFSS